jgi:hypothetical protein
MRAIVSIYTSQLHRPLVPLEFGEQARGRMTNGVALFDCNWTGDLSRSPEEHTIPKFDQSWFISYSMIFV